MEKILEKIKKGLEKNKQKKYIIGSIVIIVIIVIITYLTKNMIISNKNGNNKNSQEIIDNILNISSYKIMSDVEITGNKTTNKYIIKQEYYYPDKSIQEVIEPSNISGIRITRQDDILTIENTSMGLIKIYEDYEYISENILDLSYFIEKYKNNQNREYIENDNQIILENIINENSEKKVLKLYIDKQSGLPQKMTINDTGKNQTINILYIEVELN